MRLRQFFLGIFAKQIIEAGAVLGDQQVGSHIAISLTCPEAPVIHAGQVWDWRIADGKPLKNFTEDTNPILQVAPFNDATYFCSVPWLTNAGPKAGAQWI